MGAALSRLDCTVHNANDLIYCHLQKARRLNQRRVQQTGLPCLKQVSYRGRSPHSHRVKTQTKLVTKNVLLR